jgi:hypothetical protein
VSIRRLTVCSLAFALAHVLDASAQSREHRRHDFDDPEGRLIAYYSSALLFSPLGAPSRPSQWSIDAGLELTYIPKLSQEQRTAFQDKPQATNLAPILPRPRVSIVLPGELQVQASWVPPVRLFDVEANLVSVAITRALEPRGITIAPRLVGTWGRVKGSITCYDDLQQNSPEEAFYYSAICRGRPSDDHFEPTLLSAELLVSRAFPRLPFIPYGGIAVLNEKTDFDIGVINDDGEREPDHPVLELRTTRMYSFLGATFRRGNAISGTAELFYAPGSLFTVRVFGGYRFSRGVR